MKNVLVTWNTNGILNDIAEIQMCIVQTNTDVLLISETHFTNTRYATFFSYNALQIIMMAHSAWWNWCNNNNNNKGQHKTPHVGKI